MSADCSRNSKIWVRMKNSTMSMRDDGDEDDLDYEYEEEDWEDK